MALRDRLDTLYLCWLAKPQGDRQLFKSLCRQPARRIVELGMVSHDRTLRLLRLAKRLSGDAELHYTGIDLFDARPETAPRLTLKETHRVLSNQGATIRLVPGDIAGGLARSANQLGGTQLLIVSSEIDEATAERMWSFVPRMLDASSHVWVGSLQAGEWQYEQ
ncbi:MAG: hypothetical protein KDA92_22235, partial [Planctomycetales bacterium]|nr:hypothetical protein [Planctomycetales bacterium]